MAYLLLIFRIFNICKSFKIIIGTTGEEYTQNMLAPLSFSDFLGDVLYL